MKTIQITIDEALLKELDQIIKKTKESRSAIIRNAILSYLRQRRITKMEEKHKKGYEKNPIREDEFSVWEDEQVWGN